MQRLACRERYADVGVRLVRDNQVNDFSVTGLWLRLVLPVFLLVLLVFMSVLGPMWLTYGP